MNRAVASDGHVIGPPASKENSPFTTQTCVSMIECSILLELFHIVERVNSITDLSISNPVEALRWM